jgi:hypothetical protein
MIAQGSTAQKILEIPIEALPRVYFAVAATSKTPEEEWQEQCDDRLAAECLLCKMKVTGSELRQLATADPEVAVEDPKLERLRLKYCARNGCESRYYSIHIQPDSDLHWVTIKNALLQTTADIKETRPRRRLSLPSLPKITLGRHGFLFVSVAALAAVVMFFLVRHFVYGYRIPLIQEKHEYRVIAPAE